MNRVSRGCLKQVRHRALLTATSCSRIARIAHVRPLASASTASMHRNRTRASPNCAVKPSVRCVSTRPAVSKPYYPTTQAETIQLKSGSSAANRVCNMILEGADDALIKEEIHKPNFDVNSYNVYGNTVLGIAALKGRLDIVRYLVKRLNADINFTSGTQMTTLCKAAEGGNMECFLWVLQRTKEELVDAVDKNGVTPFVAALANGHYKIAKYLHRNYKLPNSALLRRAAAYMVGKDNEKLSEKWTTPEWARKSDEEKAKILSEWLRDDSELVAQVMKNHQRNRIETRAITQELRIGEQEPLEDFELIVEQRLVEQDSTEHNAFDDLFADVAPVSEEAKS